VARRPVRILAGIVGIVAIAVSAVSAVATVSAVRMEHERDAATAALATARHQVVTEAAASRVATRKEAATVHALHSQVEWDKSHLLDCWTAITRVMPRSGVPPRERYAIGAARSGRTLGYYIASCGSDAVP
jgi:hypothetical protein